MHCAEAIYWAYGKPFRTQGDALTYAREQRLQQEDRKRKEKELEQSQRELADKQLREIQKRNRKRAASREAWRQWCGLQIVRLGDRFNRLRRAFWRYCLGNKYLWLGLFAAATFIVCLLNHTSLNRMRNDDTWLYQRFDDPFYDNVLVVRWWLKKTSLSPESAWMLTHQHRHSRQRELNLSGVTTLSAEAAEALKQHWGVLYLDGLTSLSDGVAESLARHKGFLSLDGLTTLSDKAAKALAQSKGCLSLNGLTSLSPEVANELGKHKPCENQLRRPSQVVPYLSLRGLTSLSDEAAAGLAQHEGSLYLTRVTSLTDEAAKALARCKGSLNLWGLTSLTDEAAKALRANPNISLPKKFCR